MTDSKMKMRQWDYTGTIAVYEMIDPKIHAEESVSHALMLTTNRAENNGSVVLWFIGTDKRYFRRGYAAKLVEYLQSLFGEIITQWGTDAGNALMLKCGFVKTDTGNLVWTRPPAPVVAEDDFENEGTKDV
jgi:hypothetical protein